MENENEEKRIDENVQSESYIKGLSDLPQDKPLSIDNAMDLLIDILKRDILK